MVRKVRSKVLVGHLLDRLREVPDESVHMVVTSPPYWNLRDYGTAEWIGGDLDCDHKPQGNWRDPKKNAAILSSNGHGPKSGKFGKDCPCGAVRVDDQLGLEATPREYIEKVVLFFREIRRVLRSDGTCWVNMGDSYAGSWGAQGREDGVDASPLHQRQVEASAKRQSHTGSIPSGSNIKPKDLMGMPWRLAFALQDDGWYLRQDIVWCLSGGAYVYARTQKGDMPMMVRDLFRLHPETVQLWNGENWTKLLGMSKSARSGTEVELMLRSGERISCTPNHKFPTTRGLLEASQLIVGDCLTSCRLPEPPSPKTCVIDNDAAWLAGLYLAEGSRSEDTIQIAGHADEEHRWIRICSIAEKFGGTCTRTVKGKKMDIRMYGKVLNAIIDELVTGHTAWDKGFAPVVWRYSDAWLSSMLYGYLSGDGHLDEARWRLGFCRNYNLERDLRTVCARLGFTITLNPSHATFNGKRYPSFRGEIRETRSGHHNEKNRNEVLEIRKARCREVYDLGVEDSPHVFALASGVLTHNSKANPMPESVTDRCTKAHEYIFLFSKSEQYFFDAEAIKEKASTNSHSRGGGVNPKAKKEGQHSRMRGDRDPKHTGGAAWKPKDARGTGVGWDRLSRLDPNNHQRDRGRVKQNESFSESVNDLVTHRNKRSVWTFATAPFKKAHFATFPPALPRFCIKAGTSEKGCCSVCGRPFERVTEKYDTGARQKMTDGWDTGPGSHGSIYKDGRGKGEKDVAVIATRTIGWEESCCNLFGGHAVPCTVLDPFAGAGTTGLVAKELGRDCLMIELSPEYSELICERVGDVEVSFPPVPVLPALLPTSVPDSPALLLPA